MDIDQRAKKLFLNFFKHAEMQDTFLNRLRDTFFQIEFIQRRFRNMREIMSQRKFALRFTILNQQTFLINNSLLKSGREHSKAISYKIIKLSEVKKDFICECFKELAKFDFRREFLKWFLEVKLDPESSDGEEKAQEIEDGIK